jgi:hypothetical protein
VCGLVNAARTTGSVGSLVVWSVSFDLLEAGKRLTTAGIALYILLWPEDGKLWKDDILGVFDGSMFEKIATQRAQQRHT